MSAVFKKKSFLYHSAVYWAGKMLGRSISIVLLPIYTAYIAPAEYGVLSIFGIIINVLTLILSIQLPTAIFRYWSRTENIKEKESIVSSSLIMTIVFPAVVLLPLYVWARPFSGLLGVPDHVELLRLVFFEIQLALVLAVFLADIRIRDESSLYALIEIFQNFSIGAVSIFFIVYFGWGIAGMIRAQVFVFLVITIYCAPRFFKRVKIRFDPILLKKMIKFSFPLIPAAAAMAAVHTSDRIFIQKMLGSTETGVYAVGYKFGMLVSTLVTGPFLLIWQPKSFEIAHDKKAAEKYGEIFTYIVVAASFVAISLSTLSYEIVTAMVDEKYMQAYTVIPWVAWAYVFFGMAMVARVGLLVEKKTVLSAWLVGLVFLLNMIGNFVLIPTIGMNGAAVSTLFSFIVYYAVNAIFSHQFIPIKYEVKKLFILSSIMLCASFIMTLIPVDHIVLSLVSKTLLLLLILVFLFLMGFFAKLELSARLRSYFLKSTNR